MLVKVYNWMAGVLPIIFNINEHEDKRFASIATGGRAS